MSTAGRPNDICAFRPAIEKEIAAGVQSTLNFGLQVSYARPKIDFGVQRKEEKPGLAETVVLEPEEMLKGAAGSEGPISSPPGPADVDEEPAEEEETGSDDDVGGPPRKKRRNMYTKEQKDSCLKVLDECCGIYSAAVRKINEVSGFEKVDRRTLRYWHEGGKEKRKRGVKVNTTFERCVLGHLLFTVLRKIGDETQTHQIANVAHSYTAVQTAAKTAATEEPWAPDPGVSKLKYSKKWVKGFLRRNGLIKRKVTASSNKTHPKTEEVRETVTKIQAEIQRLRLKPEDIINADESGIMISCVPKCQYTLDGERSGNFPDGTEKARFTVHMGGTAAGDLLPPFIILRCSVKTADMSGSTLLDNKHLMAADGFQEKDGWSNHLWQKEVSTKQGGKKRTDLYKRPYLLNSKTSAVITANARGWMDSVTMVMWIDVLLAPWIAKVGQGRPQMVIWDNCGSHLCDSVVQSFGAHNIVMLTLPPNMTDKLQPMDLSVNMPLKSAMRRYRCQQLFQYFQKWKIAWLEGQEPAFSPPKGNNSRRSPLRSDGVRGAEGAAIQKS